MTSDDPGFAAPELKAFLTSADRHLKKKAELVLIGGSAAALAHGATSITDDIDSTEHPSSVLEAALEAARRETGLAIPVGKSTVADFPYEYESRLVRCLPTLKRLKVWALEKHDLALSKAVRCEETDLQQLAEIHQRSPFDFDTLIARFQKEMGHAIGNPVTVRERFLTMIKRLFGELKMIEAGRRVPSRRRYS